MSRKSKISDSEKIITVEKYLRGEDSINHLAALLEVDQSAVKQWIQNYQSLGPEGLMNTSKNSCYSVQLRKQPLKIIYLVAVLTWIYVRDMV